MNKDTLFKGLLRLADDHLILSQRLSEWCGHAPSIEEDLAISNIALDLLGQARALYTWAGEVEGQDRDEDALAFLRIEREYVNLQLCEMSNHDFAFTILRQMAFSLYMRNFWQEALTSSQEDFAAIASKAVKESTYHTRHTAEWVIRLGDGTEESHKRLAAALDRLSPYWGALFEDDEVSLALADAGVMPLPSSLKSDWMKEARSIFTDANLELPEIELALSGGRQGYHTEEMGYLLAELQYMQRSYPNLSW
jgi:ring-1,2-phenylacetyl-CoA epoxidase subunit PaaC